MEAGERKVTSTRTRGSIDWTVAFLAALEQSGVIAKACRAVNISRTTIWERRRDDAEFKAAFDNALTAGALLLEEEAVRRAKDGVRRIKFNPKTGEPYIDPDTGKPYQELEYSDAILLALLKRHFPQYHEKPSEVSVSTHVHNHIPIEKQREWQRRMKEAQARR